MMNTIIVTIPNIDVVGQACNIYQKDDLSKIKVRSVEIQILDHQMNH